MPDLDCTLSVSLRGARVEVCRWITSLASGSTRWGPNEVVVRGPRHTPPPPPQIALKSYATVSACLRIDLSVPARPSAAKNDDHREGVRGGRFGWGIGSAIKISCPWYDRISGITDFAQLLRRVYFILFYFFFGGEGCLCTYF